MTNRQIYQALARMAAHGCYDGKKFIVSKRVGTEHLTAVQSQMLVLMQKVSYQRTIADFGRVILDQMREPPPELFNPLESQICVPDSASIAYTPFIYPGQGQNRPF